MPYADPEARREYHRKWQEANKDKTADYDRRAYKRKKQWRADRPWTSLVASARQRAKRKGTPFDLDNEWAKARWTGRCELTNIEFESGLGKGRSGPRMLSPSIDKIDPDKGYVKDNCRFVLHCVNTAKGTGTDEDLMRIAKALILVRSVQS